MRIVGSRLSPFGPRGVLLELEDEAGRVGVGEASPLPGYSSDDIASVQSALASVAAKLAPMEDHLSIEDALSASIAPVARELEDLPSARFAVETALLDLVGRRRGASIAACFGAEHRVPVSGLVRAEDDRAIERARALVERGIEAIKVKIAKAPWERDFAVLRELRAEHPSIDLRADANGRFTLDEARRKLDLLAQLGLRFVEQPVAPEALFDLGRCATPWAADESLRLHGATERLVRAGACAAFILKPAVLGGFLASRRMAARAREAEIDVVVTHLFDGPVAIAAACELASSLGATLACGLDLHDAIDRWPPIAVPQRASAAWITPSGRSGLGVEVESVRSSS